MNKIRILIIDDNPEFLSTCRNGLDGKYHTLWASSEEQAKQMMDPRFGLIILGTLQAGLASKLQQWIKHHPLYRYIPIIVIDAYYRDEGLPLYDGLQLEADEYVCKPIGEAELSLLVERLAMNIISSDQRQAVETWWQGFLALEREDRSILASRILELVT